MMWAKYRISKLLLVGAVAGMVSACVGGEPVQVTPDRDFARYLAIEVFEAGYASIADRYIETVAVESLAMEGMKGLGTIDPAVMVSRQNNVVILSVNNQVINKFPAPKNGDIHGWATLSAEISASGRRKSPELRQVSPEKIYEAVFDSALAKLDIFSRYAGADEAHRNRAKRDGFGGIGVRFRFLKGELRIIDVMPDSPADGVGLKRNDIVIRIDGETVEGMTARIVAAKLRGPEGSDVVITALRVGRQKLLVFDIRREHIVSQTVTSKMIGKIAYFRIRSFNRDTARSLGVALGALDTTSARRIRGIILDMRGNPGGLLKQSVEVADLFLRKGRIVSTQGRHPASIQYYEANGHDMTNNLPLVVLVDGKSASAAEIVAAALQDQGRAIIVGTTSYGKGTVQTVIRLPNDGEITLTWSRLKAPSGYILHGLGVRPVICTSGADRRSQSEVQGLLKAGLKGPRKTMDAFSVWRNTKYSQAERRRSLRVGCPAERRRATTEEDVARYLLRDPVLFRQALHLSAGAAEQAAFESNP